MAGQRGYGQQNPMRGTPTRKPGAAKKPTRITRTPAVRQTSSRKKAGRKKRRGGLRMVRRFFLLALAAVAVTGGIMVYMLYSELDAILADNTFFPGVYVNGVSLSGMQPLEAVQTIYDRASAGFRDWQVDLVYEDARWTINSETLGVTNSLWNLAAEEVNRAFLVGRGDNSFVKQCQTLVDLRDQPYQAYIGSVQQSTAQVEAILREIEQRVYTSSQDAYWQFDATRSNPIVITNEVYGRALNTDAVFAQVVNMINTMTSGVIEVEIRQIEPQRTAQQISQEIVRLSRFSTEISTQSTEDRVRNVERGCLAFNGRVVSPGEKVSFNTWVGKRTKANGFYEAQEIVSGALEWGVGGGICQVSSTLYNAVVQAGLRVDSRTNHGIKVGYLDMGLDATVADGRIDFVFRNNTDQDIYLIARVDGKGKNRTCVFEIYGRPDPNGCTYKLKADKPVEDKPIPEPTYVPDTEGKYVKYTDQQRVTGGSPGYKVRRYLLTMDRNGNVINQEELSTDIYKPVAPTAYVGVTMR